MHKCSRCDAIEKAVGHNYSEHVCVSCKEYEVIILSNGVCVSTKPVERNGNIYQITAAKVTQAKFGTHGMKISIMFNFEHNYDDENNWYKVRYNAYDSDGFNVDFGYLDAIQDGINSNEVILELTTNYVELEDEKPR